MTNIAYGPNALSPEVLKMLTDWDLSASQEMTRYNEFEVYDVDGTHLFDITNRMPADGLNVMLRFAAKRYSQGIDAGREGVKQGLRTLLGID